MKVIHDDAEDLTRSQKMIAMSLAPSHDVGGQGYARNAIAGGASGDGDDSQLATAPKSKNGSKDSITVGGGGESALGGDVRVSAGVEDFSVEKDRNGKIIRALHSIADERQIHSHVEQKMRLDRLRAISECHTVFCVCEPSFFFLVLGCLELVHDFGF